MTDIESFEDLESWQNARTIVNSIYNLTSDHKFDRDYSLIDQLRRSATSIMSNIAEGFAHESSNEFRRYLFIAKSSDAEAQSQLYIAKDQNYIEEEAFHDLYDQLDHVSRQISNHIKYLKRNQHN